MVRPAAETEFSMRPTAKEQKAMLERRRKEVTNLKIPFKKASIFLDRWVQTNFRTQGGNVGGWKPFALGGRLTKKGLDKSAKLLQDSGRGRNSYLPFATKDDAGIGSDVAYMKKHEKGIEVVQRRTLPEVREVKEPITKIMNAHAKKGARKLQ